jgi:flagellum-specific peptidoglycan hydrolase FlgJ
MATNTQICNFIKLIAPDVQKAYKTLGKVKPSVCIGMACVESGAGTSKLMSSHNALWGQKVGSGRTATRYWGGKFYVAKTKEEYEVGKHVVIKDAFRSYDSVLQGALNYYELLNTSLYSRVKSNMTAEEQMQAIKACGYMTSSTEVKSVISYINRFGLTKYDFAPDMVELDKNPYKLTHNLLKVGMKNESVKWVQYELNKLGYTLACDGVYGTKTKAAVVAYQRARSLTPDGIVGVKTLRSLGAGL